MQIQSLGLKERIAPLGDARGRLEKTVAVEDKGLYVFQFMRLDKDSNAYTVNESEEAKHVDLEDDQYLGTKTVALYDPTNQIMMIQINRAGFGATLVQSYINSFADEKCCLSALLNSAELERMLQNGEIRGLEIGFWDVKKCDAKKSRALEKILRGLTSAGARSAKFVIGVGRQRGFQLNQKEVQDMVVDLGDNVGFITTAKVKVRNNLANGRIESIDLFSPMIRETLSVDLEPGKEINYSQLTERMVSSYLNRKGAII